MKKSQAGGAKEIKGHKLGKRRYMCLHRMVSVSQSMLVVQQATIALNALEGIVGCRALLLVMVETEVVLVGLFVLELLNVSLDDDADV